MHLMTSTGSHLALRLGWKREKGKKKERVSPFPCPNPTLTLTLSLSLSPNHLANELLQMTSTTVQSNIFYRHDIMIIQQGVNGL